MTCISRFPHPLRCDLFKECLKIGDAPIDKECPGNTLFDPKKVRCLPQNQVGCDNRDIPVSKIEFPFWDQFDHGCPWGLVDQTPQQSMFAIRGNCTHYVHCTSDIRGKKYCPKKVELIYIVPIKIFNKYFSSFSL